MNPTELVGQRALLQLGSGYGQRTEEYRVLEFSPSGAWVRLMNTHGNKFWCRSTDAILVERLAPLEPCPKDTPPIVSAS